MRLNQLRLFCFILAAVCCLEVLSAQEKKDVAVKTQIHASRIEENVARSIAGAGDCAAHGGRQLQEPAQEG